MLEVSICRVASLPILAHADELKGELRRTIPRHSLGEPITVAPEKDLTGCGSAVEYYFSISLQ